MNLYGEFNEHRRRVEKATGLRHTGASSNALVDWAFDCGPMPITPGHGRGTWSGDEVGRGYPHDPDDLDACRRTFALAVALQLPDEVISRMRAPLAQFEMWVRGGRNRHGKIVTGRYTYRYVEPSCGDQREAPVLW